MKKSTGVIIPAFNEASGISLTLEALQCQWRGREGLVVVSDNASDDGTKEVAERFKFANPKFPLMVIDEHEKGTGRAADTAARFAIEKGCDVIARTDADSSPDLWWLAAIDNHMQSSELALLTGPIKVRRDDLYRTGDNAGLAVAELIVRVGRTVATRNRAGLRVAAGGNLITTAQAYEKVGGFPRTAIDTTDEDMEFSHAVYEQYGLNAMRYARDVVVATSARRLRQMGRLGTLRHYTVGRKKRSGNVDIR